MAEYVKRTFKSQTIRLDGNSYRECRFEDCDLIFGARRPVQLASSNLVQCRFLLADHALTTLDLLAQLYRGEGTRAGVEGYLEMIRTGQLVGMHAVHEDEPPPGAPQA